jgi:hypothetical protein
MMDDIENPSRAVQSLKRPLDIEQVANAGSAQPIQRKDSAVTELENVEIKGVTVTNGTNGEELDAVEPASKRLKLDNAEQEAQAHKIDGRDKVKGVALVKEE